MSRRTRNRLTVFCGSEYLRGKADRARARQDLRRGTEPQPRYATGKFWTD